MINGNPDKVSGILMVKEIVSSENICHNQSIIFANLIRNFEQLFA